MEKPTSYEERIIKKIHAKSPTKQIKQQVKHDAFKQVINTKVET